MKTVTSLTGLQEAGCLGLAAPAPPPHRIPTDLPTGNLDSCFRLYCPNSCRIDTEGAGPFQALG